MPRLALLLSTLIWGATFPATKAILTQVPPFAFLFVRFILGTLIGVGIVLLWQRRFDRDGTTLRLSAVLSVVMFLGYALQTVGLQYTTASNSAFITALYVVLVPLFLRRFGLRSIGPAGLAMVGLWLLVNPSLSAVVAPATINLGDLLTLACAAAFAAHIALLESYTQRADGPSLFAWQLLLVTTALGPAAWLESLSLSPSATGGSAWSLTPVLVLGLLVNGVLATGAFAVQIWAQRLLPAHRVALILSMEPVYAAWLSWYYLGEHLDATAWFGSVLILSAVLLGTLRPAKATGSAAVAGTCG
jgi:drug/metabolite transporter (DMT)-like permease